MKINLEWLREWVEFESSADVLADELTVAGLEVDGVARAAPSLAGIVVAEVRGVRPHPDADRLSLCAVFDGTSELEIVCGAPNVRDGVKVPLAPVGVRLPGGQKIRAAKIRGVASNGMLCSGRELGLNDDVDGLLILDGDAAVGEPLEKHLRLPDHVVDIDLTPNRGDCFSVIGVARELAARRDGEVIGPTAGAVGAVIDDVHEPRLEAPEDCPRFATRIVRGIDPDARTPDWIRERLRRAGMRSISPVVDVTNYVMWELGQPLHAYDETRVTGTLRARRAAAGEKVTLLDGANVDLADDVLVIADDSGPVGLAGIMGGLSTAIDEKSVDVILESAFFAQRAIQGRARRFGLHTDASLRFERGVDPSGQVRALERATELLTAIAGGSAGPVAVTESNANLPDRGSVRLRHARVERVLGADVGASDIESWLTNLGMQLSPEEGGWNVVPPSYRFDIEIEEDLIEEVGRMLGYDSIVAVPGIAAVRLGAAPESRIEADEVADLLIARGYDEVITYSFVEPGAAAAASGLQAPGPAVSLANPISRELSVMRPSLWPGLLRAAQQNLSRQRGRCRLFEIGTVFAGTDEATEALVVAGIVAGPLTPEHWDGNERTADFYDIKSDVEAILAAAGSDRVVSWRPQVHPALGPATATELVIGGAGAGFLGHLHPELAREYDLGEGTVLFELRASPAFDAGIASYKGFPKFPHVRRDLAVVVDDSIDAAELTEVVERELGERLARTIIFDEYRGKTLDSGRKSVGLGLILQDASRTLTDADADEMLAAATVRLEQEFGATIRT